MKHPHLLGQTDFSRVSRSQRMSFNSGIRRNVLKFLFDSQTDSDSLLLSPRRVSGLLCGLNTMFAIIRFLFCRFQCGHCHSPLRFCAGPKTYSPNLLSECAWHSFALRRLFSTVTFIFLFVWVSRVSAQDSDDSLSEGASRLELRALDSQEIDLGNRLIIFNRVETPALKRWPEPVVQKAHEGAAPTDEEIEHYRKLAEKVQVTLILSTTVYDRQVTNVSWWRPEGEYVFWSSIDFNFLRNLFDFETPEVRYLVFLGIGDETTDDVKQWNSELARKKSPMELQLPLPPLVSQIPGASANHSAYSLVKVPKEGADPEVIKALEDLHEHFDLNREELVRQFNGSEARRIEQEQWLKDHPPQPKDTAINFFPIKSVYKRAAQPK